MGNNDTKLTPTNILNRSYDPSFDLIATEIVGYDGTVMRRIKTDAQGQVYIANASAASGGDGAILDGEDSGIKATVKDLTNSNPIAVAIVDASGDQIASFGGGTQYTEDAAAAANPVGTMVMGVRADTLAGKTTADGDNVAASMTDKGELYVKHTDSIPVTDNGGSLTVDGTVAVTNAGLTELAAAIDTEVQVDIVGALPAGTNNIGDVDVLSSALPTGASTSAKQDTMIGHLDGVEGLLTTIDGDTGNISTKIDTLAGAVSGTEMQVDVLTMPSVAVTNAGLTELAGAINASAQMDVNIAASGATVPVSNGGLTELAAAINSSKLDINIASSDVSLGGGTQYTEGDTDASITGTALLWEDASDTLRAVSASKPLPVGDGGGTISIDDGGGNISIDDGGNTITVDGTVAVTNAGLTALNGAISGSEVQVDVLTMPTVTVNSHAVTNAGTFAVQVDGSALTALQKIDDPVFVDDAAFTPATSSVMMAGAQCDETGTDSVDEGDAGALRMTADRQLYVKIGTALPAGTAAIGKLAANSGVDIGDVDVTSLPSIPAGNNNIGDVDIASIAAGNNNIGDVDIASIAAGDNNIGNVDIASIAAGDNNIGNVDVVTLPALPAGTNAIGKLAANSGVDIGDVDVTSLPLPTTAATATLTNVNDTNVSTTLLSATAGRKGFRIHNDSTAVLYVKYGTTASATSYTVKMVADAYLEENFYSGRVDGIWASDASGAARITELTA